MSAKHEGERGGTVLHEGKPRGATRRPSHSKRSSRGAAKTCLIATFLLRFQEAPALAGGPCSGLQPCPPAFLAIISVTVDELQRLVASFEAALQAQMACCDALQHRRMHLTLWSLIV